MDQAALGYHPNLWPRYRRAVRGKQSLFFQTISYYKPAFGVAVLNLAPSPKLSLI
jgi:hypothetical protein